MSGYVPVGDLQVLSCLLLTRNNIVGKWVLYLNNLSTNIIIVLYNVKMMTQYNLKKQF